MDKRTSMGIVGDLGKYTQFSAAEAMTAAAQTPNSGMAAGLGAGRVFPTHFGEVT